MARRREKRGQEEEAEWKRVEINRRRMEGGEEKEKRQGGREGGQGDSGGRVEEGK